jgi:hypothetical protein
MWRTSTAVIKKSPLARIRAVPEKFETKWGHLRRTRGDALVKQARCLNLVTYAVIVWNTVYMAEAVAQLKREGSPVHESDLAHIWPTRYAHINVDGRYHFTIEEARRRQGL